MQRPLPGLCLCLRRIVQISVIIIMISAIIVIKYVI